SCCGFTSRLYWYSIAGNGEFFFSSRRRHTRFSRDWSSDVCSSDLSFSAGDDKASVKLADVSLLPVDVQLPGSLKDLDKALDDFRSEERRVGKERRSRERP